MFEFFIGCWKLANFALSIAVLVYLMDDVKKAMNRFVTTWRTRNFFGKIQIIIALALFPAKLLIVAAVVIRKLWSLGEKKTK